MARVHWISNETPDRFGQGGQRRQFFQVQALSNAGHEVRVVTLAGPQDDMSIGRVAKEVHRVPALEFRGRLPLPWRRRALRRRLSEWADVIIVAHTESWLRFHWAFPRGVPVLVDFHNVFSRWTEVGGKDEADRWMALEHHIRTVADAVTVTSEREAASVPPGRAPIIVVENGIEPGEWSIEPFPASDPVLKLFGNWAWTPNANGLEWFVREVWPSVHTATGATCQIAGTGVASALADIPGVVALGRVPDLQRFLSDAWAIAVPLPESVGSPVKYAEALSVGVPVISTEQGAPGHRELPCITDDTTGWINELTDWLGHEDPPRVLGPAERQQRLDSLSWTAATIPLLAWVASRT